MKTVGLFAYGETGLSALESLSQDFKILWVVIPPKEKKTKTHTLPVEVFAKKKEIKVIEANDDASIKKLIYKSTPDAVVISSYNKILSSEILNKTKFINIHHGDLPRFKGRANINWAIINNRKEIGLTFHEAISDLDSGNIYKQFIVKITRKDTVRTVYDKFNTLIKKHTGKVVKKVLKGFKGKKQLGNSTYCCTRLPIDGYIDWNKTSLEIYNLVRALTNPFPGAFTYFKEKKLFIWTSEIPKNPKVFEGRIPGRVIAIHKDLGVEVLTKDSSIIIKDVTFNTKAGNAVDFIKSVKVSLGINIVEIFEKLNNQ